MSGFENELKVDPDPLLFKTLRVGTQVFWVDKCYLCAILADTKVSVFGFYIIDNP